MTNQRIYSEETDALVKVVTDPAFLKMEGLNNEVPFFIYPYEVHETVAVQLSRTEIIKRAGQQGVRVLDICLYDLSLEILNERGILDQLLDVETDYTKDEFKELLQGVLDTRDHLIPKIATTMEAEPHDVIFLSGVGEVFPYVRSHNILNNLQSTAKDVPTLLFFPGDYSHNLASGASLDLFGKLTDDKYYRAFNILDYEVQSNEPTS